MIKILCTDAKGSMLWDLQSNPAEKYFKCWNTAIKLVYGVPRSTYRTGPWTGAASVLQLLEVESALPVQKVPAGQMWRLGLRSKLMEIKQRKYMDVKDNQRITAMLDSLCST